MGLIPGGIITELAMLQVKDRHGLAEMMTGLPGALLQGMALCASFSVVLIGSGNSCC